MCEIGLLQLTTNHQCCQVT